MQSRGASDDAKVADRSYEGDPRGSPGWRVDEASRRRSKTGARLAAMVCPLKLARRLPRRLATWFAALAILATLWAPSSAGANDDYAAAMAQEHAGENPSASPAASASARRAVSGENVVYAKIAGRDVGKSAAPQAAAALGIKPGSRLS